MIARLFISLLVFLPFISFSENLIANNQFEEWGRWTAHGSAHAWNRWRSHDTGTYTGAILGEWATRGRQGSLKQSGIPLSPGRYFFSTWFWADLGWNPGAQWVRIEYFDQSGNVIGHREHPIIAPLKNWYPVELILVPPEGTISASVEFAAEDISYYGSLAVDDVFLWKM